MDEVEEDEFGLDDLLSCGSVQAVANSLDLDQVILVNDPNPTPISLLSKSNSNPTLS